MRLNAPDRLSKIFALALTLPFAIALIRDTVYQGQDFEVFYRAGLNIIDHLPVYDLSRDGAMVFKYPPWIAPIFVPFALFPLWFAKYLWGAIQVLSIAYLFHWVRKQGVRFWIAFISMVSFWGIWAVHALDGQVTLPFLVLYLRAFDGFHESKSREKLFPHVLAWASTVKIFTALILLGSTWAKWDRKKAALSLFILLFVMYPTFLAQQSSDLIEFFKSWFLAASSGADQFGLEKIYGRENQGLPALVIRSFSFLKTVPHADLFVFLALATPLSFFWMQASKKASKAVQWAGWIAIAAIVHPLAWVHHFVLVYPLLALALESAFASHGKSKNKHALVMGLLLVFITLLTGKTLSSLGIALELVSIKSLATLGVLLFLGLNEIGQSTTASSHSS